LYLNYAGGAAEVLPSGSAKRLIYASTGLSCLVGLDYLPVDKQKANNHSLEVFQPQLKRHYGWQPEEYETAKTLSGVSQAAAADS